MIELDEETLNNYVPDFKTMGLSYKSMFKISNLKIILIATCVVIIGLLLFIYVPSSNSILNFFRWVVFILFVVIVGGVSCVKLSSPLIKVILQSLIGMIQLLKLSLWVIQFFIHTIITKTIIFSSNNKEQDNNNNL